MTGWDEHGFAVETGLPIDRYLGQGDLQDAENCCYSPASVLAELGVDESHGPADQQFRDGYITLLDGTWLSRGGTLNCVWAVARLPKPARRQHDPGALMEEPDLYEPVTPAEDDAHMRAMEEHMEHEAEQGEGEHRG